MAVVHIERTQVFWKERFKAWRIHADGVCVGMVGQRQRCTFELPPGPCELQVIVARRRSRPLRVTLAAGDELHLECFVGNWAFAGFVELFAPDDYIVLAPLHTP